MNLKGVFTLVTTATFLDDVKEWSGPFFDAQQLGIRLNFDVDVKSAVQTDEVEVDVTQCENLFTSLSTNHNVVCLVGSCVVAVSCLRVCVCDVFEHSNGFLARVAADGTTSGSPLTAPCPLIC